MLVSLIVMGISSVAASFPRLQKLCIMESGHSILLHPNVQQIVCLTAFIHKNLRINNGVVDSILLMPNLRELRVFIYLKCGVELNQQATRELVINIKNLRILSICISSCHHLPKADRLSGSADAVIEKIVEHNPRLETLTLLCVEAASDESLVSLSRLRHLTQLTIGVSMQTQHRSCNFTTDGIIALLKEGSRLTLKCLHVYQKKALTHVPSERSWN